MAILHIIEGSQAATGKGGTVPVHRFPLSGIPHATLTTSGTSDSHSFNGKEKLITLISTGDVHIKLGSGTVTATTSDMYLPGYTYFSFEIEYNEATETPVLAAIDAA